MKNLILITIMILLFCCQENNSTSVNDEDKDCLLKELASREKIKKTYTRDSFDLEVYSAIMMNLFKLNKVKINPKVNWSLSEFEIEKDREFNFYEAEFVQKHNAIVGLICVLINDLEDENISSERQAVLQARVDRYIDEYFNYLLFRKVLTPQQDTSNIDEEDVDSDPILPSEIKKPNRHEISIDEEVTELTIYTIPPAGEIYLNGEFQGLSNKTIKLVNGTYSVRISKPGYHTVNDMLVLPERALLTYTLDKVKSN